MSQYPLLATMRAKRKRDEAELAAPHIAAVQRALAIAREEQKARQMLERLMQNKLLPHVMEGVGRNLGEGVYKEVMRAIASQKSFTGTTKLELPTDMLMSADPKSVVASVVDWWRHDVAPKMDIRAMTEPTDASVLVLDIRLPSMAYRQAVFDSY